MDDIVNQLINAASLEGPSTIQNKQQTLVNRDAEKSKQTLSNLGDFNFDSQALSQYTGLGSNTRSDMDRDLMYLTPLQLEDKYGSQAASVLLDQARGAYDRVVDSKPINIPGQGRQSADSALALTSGIGNSVLGIAGLSGIVSPEAGRQVSKASEIFNEYVQGLQSDHLNQSREYEQATMELRKRDNEALSDSEWERVARDSLSAVQNMSGSTYSDALFQGLGSLAGGGGIAKGVTAVGSRVAGSTARRRAAQESGDLATVTQLENVGRKAQNAAMIGTITATESGAVYSDITNRIMAMPFEELLETSAYARKVFEMTGSVEETYNQTAQAAASKGAKQMAAIAGPIAPLVSRFEMNPLRASIVGSTGSLAANTVAQTVEEAIQGGSAEYLAGRNIQEFANETIDPLESVGEGIGVGAVTGAGMTAAIQGPTLATRTAAATALVPVRALQRRAERNQKAIDDASPLAPSKLTADSSAVAAAAPILREQVAEATVEMTPEQQAPIAEYTERVIGLGTHTDGQYALPTQNEITEGSQNKFEAIQRFAEVAGDTKADPALRVDAAIGLLQIQQETESVVTSNMEIFEGLADDHPAAQMANDIITISNSTMQNPQVTQAVDAAMQIIQESSAPVVTPESVQTPEGQADVQRTIQQAQVAPGTGSIESMQVVLDHIDLPDDARIALEMSLALAQAEAANATTRGLSAESARVSNEVTIEGGKKSPSISEHAKGIYTSLKEGNIEQATERLQDYGNFVQSLSNKVEAINEQIADNYGAGRKYQAWNPSARTWYEGPKAWLNPKNTSSVNTAKSLNAEAGLAADVYNRMLEVTGLVLPTMDIPSINDAVVNPNYASPVVQATAPAQANQAKRDTKKTDNATDQQAYEQMAPEPVTIPTQEAAQETESPTPASVPVEPQVRIPDVETTVDTLDTAVSEMSDKELTKEINRLLSKNNKTPEELNDLAAMEIESATRSDAVVTPEPVEEVTPTESVDAASIMAERQETRARQDVTTEQPAPETVFTHLVNATDKTKNVFLRSFNVPTKPKSNYYSVEQPINSVKSAIETSGSLGSILGDRWTSKTTDHNVLDAWDDYLSVGNKITQRMNARLQEFLTPRRIENLESGKAFMTEGSQELLLNLAEKRTKKDGSTDYMFNRTLLENSVLAAMSWYVNESNNDSYMDAEEVASALGIDSLDVTEDILTYANTGTVRTNAERKIAQKIKDFWGVNDNPDAYTGDIQGITESMAMNIVQVMADMGMFTEESGNTIPVRDTFGEFTGEDKVLPDKIVAVDGYLSVANGRKAPEVNEREAHIRKTASLLDELVLTNPEGVLYVGKGAKPVTKSTQIRNNLAKLTRQQKQVQERANNIKYYADNTIVSLFGLLGSKGITEAFSRSSDTPELFNRNHLQSVDGKNKGIVSAYEELQRMLFEMTVAGEIDGTSLANTSIQFAHEFSSVNRLQQQGKYTPQSSKLIREVILPTWTTLDLNQAEQLKNFRMSLAQALDVKLHKNDWESSDEQLTNNLNKLGRAQEIIREMLGNVDESLLLDQVPSERDYAGELKAAFNSADVPLSELSFHALVDYVKSQDAEDVSSFRTAVYLEADGMTNGPANAMMMYSTRIDEDWIERMESGGLYFNQPEATAGTKNSKEGGVKDLYEKAANNLKEILVNAKTKKGEPALNKRPIYKLFNVFNSDFNLVGEDDVNIGRNLIKNPLTVLIYGSGVNGVANKITSNLVDSIYERMTDALHRMSDDPSLTTAQAIFPDATTATEANRLLSNMTWVLNASTDGNYRFNTAEDLQNLTIQSKQFESLSKDVLHNLARPMFEAMGDTVGTDVLENSQRLRTATNVMSIAATSIYRDRIKNQIEQNKANNPDYRERQLVTVKQEREAEEESAKLAALFGSKTQNYLVKGNEDHTFVNNNGRSVETARTMGKKTRSSYGHSVGFAPAGVKGSATMTISIDGQMIQNGIMSRSPVRSKQLFVFDGVNTPADGIQDVGQQMNTAVLDSWRDNTLGTLATRFNEFLGDVDISSLSQEMKLEMSRSFVEKPMQLKEPLSDTEITKHLNLLGHQLTVAGRAHEAIVDSFTKRSFTLDQMASTNNPLVANADQTNADISNAELAKQMQDEVNASLNAPQQVSGSIDSILYPEGISKDNVAFITKTTVQDILDSGVLTADQKTALDMIMQGDWLNNWIVVAGNNAALDQAAKDGIVDPAMITSMRAKGSTGRANINTKTVVLNSAGTEVFVHELIHAAVAEKITEFYKGKLGKLKAEELVAIKSTEALMNQFLDMNPLDFSHDQASQRRIIKLQAMLNDFLDAGNKNSALNEFIAYSLTNRQLTRTLENTEASPLAQLFDRAWQAVKNFIAKSFGNKFPETMLEQLQFNTGVLAQRTLPRTVDVINSSPLDHTDLNITDAAKQAVDTLQSEVFDNLDDGERDIGNRYREGTESILQVAEVIRSVSAAFPELTADEIKTVGDIAAVVATENNVNPKDLSDAHALMDHVLSELTLEHFMEDSTDASQQATARAKFNTLIGRDIDGTDGYGRSSLLPVFVGLSMVSPEVKSILANMEKPKNLRSEETGLDGHLENVGYRAMQMLGDSLTSTSKSENLLDAANILGQSILRNQENQELYAQRYIDTAGGVIDRANQFMVDLMEKTSDMIFPDMTDEEKATRTKWEKGTDAVRVGVAALISEEKGGMAADLVTQELDKANISEWFRNLMSDFTGRTDSNKLVWDMVKQFRSKIQVVRQGYRTDLPKVIRSKFTRDLSNTEWASLNTSVGKTELGSLLLNGVSMSDVMLFSRDADARQTKIKEIEALLPQGMKDKVEQLAHYMNTGEVGNQLHRNAYAIVTLHPDSKKMGPDTRNELVTEVDQLVTLKAIDTLPAVDKDTLASIVTEQEAGLTYSIGYLKSQIEQERANAVDDVARLNMYKGHMPFETTEDSHLIVARDSDYSSLVERGYTRVDKFTGSTLAPMGDHSYYFRPRAAKAAFKQGIIQNVKQTVGGVDPTTGRTIGTIVNTITEPSQIRRISKFSTRERGLNLMPVFDGDGNIVAYEQGIDPAQRQRVAAEADLASNIGNWRGRLVEEYLGPKSNYILVDNLKKTYDDLVTDDHTATDRFENLFDSKDPVVQDAISLMPPEIRMYIESVFGEGQFPVLRNMVKDVAGYRDATVGDLWTGNTRLSPKTTEALKRTFIGIMGKEAYNNLTGAERIVENLALNAKILIAVKSGIVPAINLISNLLHLVSRGVPVMDIYRQSKVATSEINTYAQNRTKYLELEADAQVESDPRKKAVLHARMQGIEDANRRLSVWPLIEAGEFSAVSDADTRHMNVKLTSGKLNEYLEDTIDRLPDGVNTAGRYFLISKDTALFNGMQKTVEYGDFVAKSILYKDLVERQGKSKEDALGRITEEFISYDHLPGRARGKLEQMGLYWFGNFKLRSAKVALSTVRNNPLHTLLALGIPAPSIFGSPGIPIEDNIFTKFLNGTAGYAIGPEQGFNSIGLNPWLNIVD